MERKKKKTRKRIGEEARLTLIRKTYSPLNNNNHLLVEILRHLLVELSKWVKGMQLVYFADDKGEKKKKTSRALHLLVPPNVPNGVIKGDVQDKRRSNRNPQ